MTELAVMDCNECGRPWGIVLPRGLDDTTLIKADRLLRAAWADWCEEMWVIDVSDDVPCPTIPTPDPTLASVVHLTDAVITWLDELGFETVDEPCWTDADGIQAPVWWVNKRRRFALRWDCCNLDDPRNHPLADASAS